jgi:hypothetical protein
MRESSHLHRSGLQGPQDDALVQRVSWDDLPVIKHAQTESLALQHSNGVGARRKRGEGLKEGVYSCGGGRGAWKENSAESRAGVARTTSSGA